MIIKVSKLQVYAVSLLLTTSLGTIAGCKRSGIEKNSDEELLIEDENDFGSVVVLDNEQEKTR